MRIRNHTTGIWITVLACLAAAGCASTGAPDDWLPIAHDAPRDPYGAWVTVEYIQPHDDQSLAGEFLAVDNDSLYVLTSIAGTDDPVIGISLDIVKQAKIAHFDPQTQYASLWVVTGTISSLSHGMAAAITMPLWVILGSTMAASQSRTPLENYPRLGWDQLKMYARFPQGPPPSLHQLGLRPKPKEFSSRSPAPEPTPS